MRCVLRDVSVIPFPCSHQLCCSTAVVEHGKGNLMDVVRHLRALGCATVVSLLAAAPALAAPLGLSPGDEISSIAIDALKTGGNPGDGGNYDSTTLVLDADGRATSVGLAVGGPLFQSDVTYHFDSSLLAQAVNLNLPFVTGNADLGSPGGSIAGPDFIIKEAGVNILWGNFSGLMRISGTINIADNSPQQLSALGLVKFTGGNVALLNALGGVGGMANIVLGATIGDFAPGLGALVADGNIWNSDFTLSLTGTLTPLTTNPFVPEPSTALLTGGGLLALIGVARRSRAGR
jgi:hypothetical protein